MTTPRCGFCVSFESRSLVYSVCVVFVSVCVTLDEKGDFLEDVSQRTVGEHGLGFSCALPAQECVGHLGAVYCRCLKKEPPHVLAGTTIE